MRGGHWWWLQHDWGGGHWSWLRYEWGVKARIAGRDHDTTGVGGLIGRDYDTTGAGGGLAVITIIPGGGRVIVYPPALSPQSPLPHGNQRRYRSPPHPPPNLNKGYLNKYRNQVVIMVLPPYPPPEHDYVIYGWSLTLVLPVMVNIQEIFPWF